MFLDEPTAGLDPQARHATWELIESLRAAGAAVILATHYMEEAERLADQVVIVDHGQVVASGSPAELTGTAGQLRFRAQPGLDTDGLLAALPAGAAAKESPAGHYVVERPDGIDPQLIAAVTAWCAEHGVLARAADREQDAGGRVPGADRTGAALMMQSAGVVPLAAQTGPRPRPGAAPLRQMVGAQAALELRTLVRNGEQLLLTLVIPVVLLVTFGHENLISIGPAAGSTSSCPASSRSR